MPLILTAIMGAMWGGKTTSLHKRILDEPKDKVDVFVIDWFGTRSNGRDLNELLKQEDAYIIEPSVGFLYNALKKIENTRDENEHKEVALYIDEIHLCSVSDIAEFLKRASTVNYTLRVIVAGLFSDCYNKYAMFPCWGVITPLAANVHTMCVPMGRVKCCSCGATKNIVYTTVNTESDAYKNGEVIGDHYWPICYCCAQEQVKCGTTPSFPKKKYPEDEGYGISPTGLFT